MIEPNIYCKVSGMAMRCISQLNSEGHRLPTVIEVGCADGQGTMRYAGFCAKTIAIDAMLSGRPDIVMLGDGSVLVDGHAVSVGDLMQDHSKVEAFTRRTEGLSVELITGLSTDPRVLDDVRGALVWGPRNDELADIVIIDGCHHPFESVWADVVAYHQFVRPGGFMILDDLYEECIERAYVTAISELGYTPFDRWRVARPDILQEVAALRRPDVSSTVPR